MSVKSVREITTMTKASNKQTQPVPPTYVYEAERTFIVEFDSTDPANAVAAAVASAPPYGAMPLLGEQFPGDSSRGVISVAPEAHPDNPQVFTVTVGYSSTAVPVFGGNNPLALPPEISWDEEETMEPRAKDGDGNPILNTAGDPFDPPPMFEFADPVLTITRNQASYNEVQAIQYANAVNTDTFHGALPGQAKMKPISATQQVTNGISYWRVTYRIKFRGNNADGSSGWTRLILDEGLRELDPDQPGLIDIYLKGVRVNAPAKLDGHGQSLDPGEDPAYVKVPPWKKLPFSALGLP